MAQARLRPGLAWVLAPGLLALADTAGASEATVRCAALAGSYNEPGIGIDRAVYSPQIDVAAAEAACTAALAEARSPQSLFRMARVKVRKDDHESARALLEEAAGAQYPPAMALAGYLWLFGVGGPEKPEEGLELARLAESQGDRTGTFYVGLATELGLSGPADPVEASRHYARAIAAGDVPALTRMAWLVLFDDRVSGDLMLLIPLLERAADRGFHDAAWLIGEAHRQGRGTATDLAQAAGWFRRAATLGSPNAASELAGMHLRGGPSGIDDAEALALARQAGEAGSDVGLHLLGQFLAGGRGTPADPEGAVAAWEEAWSRGYAPAGIDLAAALIDGTGTAPDPDRARTILETAREADPVRAEALRAKLGDTAEPEGLDARVDAFIAQEIARTEGVLARIVAEMCDIKRRLCDGRVCDDLPDGTRVYATMDGHGWYQADGRRVDPALVDETARECF